MIRAVLREYFGLKGAARDQPIIIIAAKDQNTLKTLLPEFWANKGSMHPAGVYLGGLEKSYVGLRLDVSLNREAYEPYEPVYHEYVHYLMRRLRSRLPLWMVEGLAEFFGNIRIEGKHVYVGTPSTSSVIVLRQTQLLPLNTLFQIDASSAYYHEENKVSIFYAESWALTHYLIARDWREKTHRVNDFVSLLGDNVEQLDAARRTIGDPNALERALSQYVHQSAFTAATLEAPAINDRDFATRTIPDAESLAVRADFMLHDRHYTEAQEMLEQALRLDPKLASAYESMGLLYSHQGKATEAGKWYSEALALESKSYLAHYYYAINLLKSGLDEDAVAKVETSLRTALKINPDFAPAYNSLAYVLLLSSHSQNLDEAYMLTLHAIELEPGNALYWITSARALQRLGRVSDAQRAAKLAVSMAKTPNERAEAAAALTSIQQFQSRPKPGQNSNGTSDGAYFFYKEALAAARAGNYAEAANGLKQLLELEPAHSSARNELGRIYLRQDQLDLAAASFRKQIEMNPSDPYAYNNLGLVLERQGKWEEAVQSFRKQLQINPDDRNAHENLAFLFEKQQKYTLAAPELQRAVAANPKNPALLVALASVYRKSGEEEKCKSALRNAEKIAETPQSWNSIAWFMALREFSLDEALKYAQRAVASVATSLSAVSLDHITSRELHDVSALASYWDTLGWVYFQRKELPNAEKYLLAAWQLRRDGVIGNHIGQVYEKLGRKDDAIRHYSLSLATPNPEPGTSDRLVALAGKDAISAEKLAAYSDQLAETSVVQIPGAPKIDAAADFYVELAPAQMPNVRFICGNPALKSLTGLLPSAPYELSFPDSQPVKLILRGELTCGGSDAACRLKLLSPSVASLESADAPGTVEILGDTMGVSFSTYSQALRESVRANWLKLAPEKARSPNKKRANVSIFFAILRDGKLDQLDISRSSGDVELDRAAFDAILRAAPFPPLPSGFARSSISFRFNFHYNPGPDSCVTNGAL